MKNSSLWLWLLTFPNMSIKLHKTFNNFSCRRFLVVSVLGHSFLFPRIMGVPHFWKLCLPCCHFFDRLCDNISLELLLGSKCLWFESLFSKYRTLFPCISLSKILVSLLAKFWYALVRLLFDVFYQGKRFTFSVFHQKPCEFEIADLRCTDFARHGVVEFLIDEELWGLMETILNFWSWSLKKIKLNYVKVKFHLWK